MHKVKVGLSTAPQLIVVAVVPVSAVTGAYAPWPLSNDDDTPLPAIVASLPLPLESYQMELLTSQSPGRHHANTE